VRSLCVFGVEWLLIAWANRSKEEINRDGQDSQDKYIRRRRKREDALLISNLFILFILSIPVNSSSLKLNLYSKKN
jgi:hypothetical protein